jgi:hypothetical protein
LHMIEPPPARDHQTSIKYHKLGFWRNFKKCEDFYWAHHGWNGRCWMDPWGASLPLLAFFLQSFLYLVLGFILALECREEESCKWMSERESEVEWIQLVLQFVLTCASKGWKWKIAHFPLIFNVQYPDRRSSRFGGWSSNSLSMLNWLANWYSWRHNLRHFVLRRLLIIIRCWWCQ